MASSLQSLQGTLFHHRNNHRQTLIYNDTPLFLKPNVVAHKKIQPLHSTSSSITPSTKLPVPSPSDTSLDLLSNYLSTKNYRLADDETRRLIIALAGEDAQSRGYVFSSEVQFISSDDLVAIDKLWLETSGGRYGYSVQKRLWEKSLKDFNKFFIRVGWMKKLETEEVEQHTYRSFPTEFMWTEDEKEVPEGHLPLTNALRGKQLLLNILMHPAFEHVTVRDADEDSAGATVEKTEETRKIGLGLGNIKSKYSF